MMFRAITIAALAGFVSANSYSIGCMTTLMNIGNNPEVYACLSPDLLLPVLVGLGNGPESVVGPLDAWLGSMCALPACSSDTLAAVVNNVTAGCSVEYGMSQVQQTLDVVQKSYRTARKVVCLKDGQTNCVTQTLKNIEGVTGTMNLNDDNVVALTQAGQAGFPASVTCTNCMKGAFTILNQDLPGFISANYTQYVTNTCGASYTDGGIPPGLLQTAWEPSTSTSSVPPAPSQAKATATPPVAASPPAPTKKKSSALGRPSSLFSPGMAVTGLAIIWAGMTFA